MATGGARVTAGAAIVRLRFSAAARQRLRGRRSALRLVIGGRGVRQTVFTLRR